MARKFRTNATRDAAVAALSEAEGVSSDEVIRPDVPERNQRTLHWTRVDAVAQQLLERWGDVLNRLGTA